MKPPLPRLLSAALLLFAGCAAPPEVALAPTPVSTPAPAFTPAPTASPAPAFTPATVRTNQSVLPPLPHMMDDAPRPTFVPAPTPKLRPGQTLVISNARALPTPRQNPTIIVSNAPVPAADISARAAAARDLVWVNTASRELIYHRPGSRFYGGTRNGYYTSETQARARGYRASLR